MPRSLFQKAKKDPISLTDIDRNLTGKLGQRGFFDSNWIHLKQNQFYQGTVGETTTLTAPLFRLPSMYEQQEFIPLITVRQAVDYKLAFEHDNKLMIPLINGIFKYDDIIKNHRVKKFVFTGKIYFIDKDLSNLDDKLNEDVFAEEVPLSPEFPDIDSKFDVFKQDFNKLSIYTLLKSQLDVAYERSFDIFDRALNLTFNLANDNVYFADAQDILYHLDKLKQDTTKYNQSLKDAIIKHPDEKDLIHHLIISNTDLMLMNNINELKAKTDTHLQNPVSKSDFTKQNPLYTKEQLDFITSNSRNIVAMAGAGTGKSTALGGRIKYLKQSGIDPKNILVLSFTNAAANNIKQRFPGVQSSTIAATINSVYMGFFNHTLSTPDTVINSLRLLDDSQGNLKVREDLIHALSYISASRYFKGPDYRSYNYEILSLLYKNPLAVTQELDLIGQTTFELQQSILYFVLSMKQKLPQELQDIDFILVDEAQDTSLFELIFLTHLATSIDSDLCFIGDANQTLYEFRNAKANSLNLISDAKQVSHYIFDINHRSNNYILSMANEVLKVLDTNAKANMQLMSSNLNQLTIDEFKKHVKVVENIQPPANLNTTRGTQASSESLSLYLKNSDSIKKYIDNALNNNEQVAFLAMSRMEVSEFEKWLTQNYGSDKIQVISPVSTPWSSRLSSALVEMERDGFWKTVPNNPRQAAHNIATEIYAKIQHKSKYNVAQWIVKAVSIAVNSTVYSSPRPLWQRNITSSIERSEIRHNKVRNSLIQSEPVDLDKPFIISTVHSAKGLEFPHVVLATMENQRSGQQDSLRALGVALTRAKDDEFIINSSISNGNVTRSVDISDNSVMRHPISSAKLRATVAIKDQA